MTADRRRAPRAARPVRGGSWPRRHPPPRTLTDLLDTSDRLVERSRVIQEAAAQATRTFRTLVRRSIELCGR